MAINIKDERTDRLVRELVAETGESITEATRISLAERLDRVRARRSADPGDEFEQIIGRGRARRTIDDRAPEDILGFDGAGVPS